MTTEKPTPTLTNKQWQISSPLSSKSLLERICKHRKVNPKNDLEEMHSPWSLKDIQKATDRLEKAIQDQQRIMIFGDYDVDGVSGSSILYLGLKALGAVVSVRLPHREKDGYGLNTNVVDECKDLGVSLLITVDCGISNVKEVAYANERGLQVIITDHHAIPPQLPDAFAILNPKQPDCEYPDKAICGTVVAYKLLIALSEQLGSKEINPHDFMDMAALATVADCMPLRGENRFIVQQGLVQMQQTKHRGLRTLVESYDLSGKPLSSYHLGFNIAPCINAAGRLEDPLIAFKMMMGDTEKALELRRINQERQDIVRSALEEALNQVEREHVNDPVLVFWNDNWQPGIIGLLAGKLCERYHKPVICLTKSEDKYVGSCRSIPQINIVEQLQQMEELFLNYGGHAQAAGLSLHADQLDALRRRMIKQITAFTKDNPIEAILTVDTEITPTDISLVNWQLINRLEPFGMGNPRPKFLMQNLQVKQTRAVGSDQSHLQLGLVSSEGEFFKGIAFQMAQHEQTLQSWKNIDVICQLNKNDFRGNISIDLQLVDARPSQKRRQ